MILRSQNQHGGYPGNQIGGSEYFGTLDRQLTAAELAARDKPAIMENTVFTMPSAVFPPFPPPSRTQLPQSQGHISSEKSVEDRHGESLAEQAFAKLYNGGYMPSLQIAAQTLYSEVYAEFFPEDANAFSNKHKSKVEMARFHRAYQLKGMDEMELRSIYNSFMGIDRQ